MHLPKSIAISLLVVLTFGFSKNVTGQPFKPGKISAHDFITGDYQKDPDASAVVLYDYGSTSVELDVRQGNFFYLYRKQMRVQILDERGLDWANHTISLYESGASRETMSKFSGFVHQLENGKVKSLKIKSRDGMTEQTSETRKSIKFSFPEVKPGSVVEINYSIRSPFLYNLQPWQFQYSIPVEYSEYNLSVPEFFNYQNYVQGYEPFSKQEVNMAQHSYQIPGRRATDNVSVVPTRLVKYHWLMKDAPAMADEPFTNNISNYVTRIRFELASEMFPGQSPTRYVMTWADADKRLHEDEDFGGFLSGTRQLRQEMQALDQVAGSEMEKITGAMQYIQDNIRWNQRYGIWASSSPRQVLRQGEGNSAEVNLMLIAALRQLGLQAHPVASSTRNNGMLVPGFPTLSGFNYLVAHVKLEDGTILLLDATDSHCPPGMLPARALNGQGRLLEEGKEKWIDLNPRYPSSEKKKYHFTLDAQGGLRASATLIRNDYAAYSLRKKLESQPDLDKYKEQLQTETPGMLISKLQLENQDDIHQPVIENLEFSVSDAVSHTGDMIFFKPLLFEGMEVNPFRLENRKFPVDFTFPLKEEITMVYDLPEGYQVDFIPQPMRISFRNQMIFDFSTTINEQNQLEVQTTFEAPNHIIEARDYSELKEFFNKMVEKHNEQITLKKVS